MLSVTSGHLPEQFPDGVTEHFLLSREMWLHQISPKNISFSTTEPHVLISKEWQCFSVKKVKKIFIRNLMKILKLH